MSITASAVSDALSSLSPPQVVILILAVLVAIGLLRAALRAVKVTAKVALIVAVVLVIGGVGVGAFSGQ